MAPSHRDEVILTCQNLEDGGEVEASALEQFEELKQKRDEGEEAEEHGQDHEGLHRLDPVCAEAKESMNALAPRFSHDVCVCVLLLGADVPSLLPCLQW